MEIRIPLVFGLFAVLLTTVAAAESKDIIQIFNGKDLTGWEGSNKYWSVKDWSIVARSTKDISRNEFLWSATEVKDFYLSVNVRLTPHNRHGGIQFRSKPNNKGSRAIGYQADMGHVAAHGNLWGRLYEEDKRGILDWNTHGTKAVKPGEWNRYEILAVGHRIWTAVNGTVCTAIEDPSGDLSGRLGLGLSGGPAKTVQYRILAFSHDPDVTLAGLNETQLIAKLRKPGTNELVNADDFAAARKAAAAFRVPEGLSIDVYAASPQLTNPVAICLDEQGRVYVAEDHRFLAGTPENRSHNFMLEDDLQITTLEDRLEMQKKWAHKFDKGFDWFTQKSDIVRQLEDKDGDGRADVSRVFADGFDGPLDGLGSGLIARDGKVWYTCIPNLWLLEDQNGDGKAEHRKRLLTGFGVNAAFYGHDLHGLVWGVDGKLYFSVGDRGAHVITKEGTTISNPRQGAVYRCNPDGTELERVHQGLRNPQELAIDQYGNVFADDNNCDKGDDSRLVFVVPGGDSGWNMAYQTIAQPYLTGPWHAEAMWHLQHDLQPAFIVPSVGKIGAGPSGFVFSSGTSLPPRYRNHFFYCNFTGNGGVESFAVKEQGAGFTIADHHDFCKPIQASDVEFGYDGKMYVAEYPTSPWKRETSGGRIYTISDKSRLGEPVTAETPTLFQKGFRHRTTKELASLLHHDDMRVRLRAQFALAERGNAAAEVFAGIALRDDNQLARLHAIWGLGQIGRTAPTSKTLAPVIALLEDEDSEVRAQSARVLGDAHYEPAANAIAKLLADDTPRVRFFAALASGALRSRDAGDVVVSMLRENDGKDRYLTHAGVVALEKIGDREFVQQWAGDKSAAVRMAVLLVQRRWSDPRIAQFLDDAQLEIVTEAARAINDLPLTTGRDKLAELAQRFKNASGENVVPLMRRIINANLQLGSRTNVEAVIGIATSDKQPMVIRTEAVSTLSVWHGPTKRDRVTGFWHPIAARDPSTVRDVVQHSASKLLSTAPKNLLAAVTKLLTSLDVKTDDRAFAAWVADSNRSSDVRIAALRLLENCNYDKLPEIIDTLLVTNNAELRAEARDLLASRDEARATSIFSKLLDDQNSEVTERQRAIASLARLKSPAAGQTLDDWADRLRKGKVPASLQLDLIEAFTASPSASREAAMHQFDAFADESDPLVAWRLALTGGNAKSGRDIFVGHAKAQCIRCHKIDDSGGTAGPDLSKIASPQQELDRRHYLESIVLPKAKIAKGFGTVAVVLGSGKVVAGKIKAEDDETLTLVTPQNRTIRIDRSNIDEQTAPTSAMPEMTKALTLREIRDLVEYLATLGKNK
jgi:quinoprotein glucose dehydrogenase